MPPDQSARNRRRRSSDERTAAGLAASVRFRELFERPTGAQVGCASMEAGYHPTTHWRVRPGQEHDRTASAPDIVTAAGDILSSLRSRFQGGSVSCGGWVPPYYPSARGGGDGG